MVKWSIEFERIWFGMEHEGMELPTLEQESTDEALLVELQRALDAQASEWDAYDRKASTFLSTAGIIATILVTLLGWWFSDPSVQVGICPLIFVPAIVLFAAVVGVSVRALWIRSTWRPIRVSVEDIEEYRSLDRMDLTAQLLSQYIVAHERNHDVTEDKIAKVKLASVSLLLGVLYLAILQVYVILTR